MIPLIGILGLVAASRTKPSSGDASSPGGMAPVTRTERGDSRPVQDRAAISQLSPATVLPGR